MKGSYCFVTGFFLTIIIANKPLTAQENSYAAWLQAGVNFDIIKDLTCEIAEQLRYSFESEAVYLANTDVSLSYKFNKHFKAGAEYRLKRYPGFFTHRPAVSATYSEGFNDFDVSLRTKYQHDFGNYILPDNAWRNKLMVKYNITKDIHPFVSGELFYEIFYKENSFNNFRFETGVKWELNKHNDVDLSYLLDKEFHKVNPIALHVAYISYLYKF